MITTLLGFFLTKWTLLALALVLIVLIGAGKLIYNRYTLGALVILALGFAAWTWHGSKVAADRTATAKPYIAQIADMTEKRKQEIEKQKADADKATAENKAKELAWANAATKAKNDATKREYALKEDAASAALARDGLLRDLAASRSKLSSSTCTSIINYANTLGVIFEQCSQRYTSVARNADSHSSDTQLIMSAWPSK